MKFKKMLSILESGVPLEDILCVLAVSSPELYALSIPLKKAVYGSFCYGGLIMWEV